MFASQEFQFLKSRRRRVFPTSEGKDFYDIKKGGAEGYFPQLSLDFLTTDPPASRTTSSRLPPTLALRPHAHAQCQNTNMSAHQMLSIQHHLASILNLSPTYDEEYISEILDQLLSIEGAEDVAEYLNNFVTDESAADVELFVEELGRFKSGDVPAAAKGATVKKEEPPIQAVTSATRILDEGAAQREEIRLRELEARERQREEQERLRRKKEDQARRLEKDSERLTITETTISSSNAEPDAAQQPAAKQQAAAKQSAKAKQLTSQSAAAKPSIPMPSKPLIGTPQTTCGCFGNKHKPLTNCLNCGRISCELEGYDYCPFCNHLITQFTPSSNKKIDLALAHKERLLEYDRTSASRTHVHDDQEDYFVTQSSMWSSAQEQEEAGALEEERKKKLHMRGNQRLDIKF